MDLKETVVKMAQEEFGEYLDRFQLIGPYEGEEFNIVISLSSEPEDLGKRENSMRLRILDLGVDVGLYVELPEEAVAA